MAFFCGSTNSSIITTSFCKLQILQRPLISSVSDSCESQVLNIVSREHREREREIERKRKRKRESKKEREGEREREKEK
jgi:hypothetical protein